MQYVVVSGGIMSGLGKGITASSIAVLLQGCGWKVPPALQKSMHRTDRGLLVWQTPICTYTSYRSGNVPRQNEGQQRHSGKRAGLGPDALVWEHAASPLPQQQTAMLSLRALFESHECSKPCLSPASWFWGSENNTAPRLPSCFSLSATPHPPPLESIGLSLQCIVKSLRSGRSFISSPLWAPPGYGPTSQVQHRFSL